MTALSDVLLAADEVVARLGEERVHALTVRSETISGIYAHVQVHLNSLPSLPPSRLLEIAQQVGLTETRAGTKNARGELDGITVELFS